MSSVCFALSMGGRGQGWVPLCTQQPVCRGWERGRSPRTPPGSWGQGALPGVKPGHPHVSVHCSASLRDAKGKMQVPSSPVPPHVVYTAGEEGLDPIRKQGCVGRAEGRIWPPTFTSSSSSSPVGAGLAQPEHCNPESGAPSEGQGEGKDLRARSCFQANRISVCLKPLC